ncbi:MAG: endonuclease III [Bacteroidota bacterium]
MPTEASVLTAQKKALIAHERLQQEYGDLDMHPRRDPMHELISTMLSHRTTHADEEKAYYGMRDRFGSWENIAQAPVAELAETIASARFPEAKAPNIQKTIRLIIANRGEANIDFLRDLPTEQALKWLMDLPGVGLKTATLVLLFNFHKPVLPVDTHVHRVTQRLGIIGPKITADKAHYLLLDMLPQEAKSLFNFHKHFLWHGQKICVWGSPRCGKCVLKDICDWYRDNR